LGAFSRIVRVTTSAESWTVRRLLEWTTGFFTRKNVDPPRLSAELLLSHVLGVPRIKLYTDYDRELEPGQLGQYRALVKRAAEDEPIAYLTGRAHFFNLEFEVTRDVLIPRPDTETLVENVLQLARITAGLEAPRVLDLCTGSGCVAAAIAHHLKRAIVHATEKSAAAAEVARRNVERLGLGDRVHVEVGDLFEPIARLVDAQPFDLIVANPPYIASDQIARLDRSVREYEPLEALDGGVDGLQIHRRILAEAPQRLMPGGRIFLEIAFDQGAAALEMIRAHDAFEEPRVLRDHAGKDRVLAARKRAS
jgi:release factor glutamine methyltransferase